MNEFLLNAYPWLKSAHLVAVIAWMAGLLYLPRLFVYHADAIPGGEASETFKVMERKLLRAIMNPAMIVSWALGITLLSVPGQIGWLTEHWIHAKLAAVVVLTSFHILCARWRRDFEVDRNRRSARFFRIVNEVPTILLIVIVVLVVVRPF